MDLPEIDLGENFNGKLFADVFSEMASVSSFWLPGTSYRLLHKGVDFGIIRLEALRRVYFSKISDALAYLVCGKGAHFLAGVLTRRHGVKNQLAPDAEFFHLVFKYESRNITNQAPYLEQWWAAKTIEYADEQSND